MGEVNQELVLLIGELRGDMKEGQRQRTAQFKVLETLSHQLAELSATFSAHADHEETWKEILWKRVDVLEASVPDLATRLSTVEQREGVIEQKRGVHPTLVTVGIGGTGLLGILFGDRVSSFLGKAFEACKKLLH